MGTHATVLFDGYCNLCNASVNFVIERDKEGYFKFGPLQSEAANALGERVTGDPDSIVLIEDGKRYEQSSAALRIARKLDGAWPLVFAFIVVPPFIRNGVYRYIARNRYQWFGKTDACRIPSPEYEARFRASPARV